MDGAGGVVVAWGDPGEGEARILVALRAPGGAFSAPVAVSRPGGAAGAPQVATAPSGDALVVWRRTTATGSGIQAAARRGPGGAFAEPVDLAPADAQAFAPQVAVAPSGAAVVTWLRFDGAHTVVEAATRPPGGDAFSAARRVSAPGGDARVTQAAIDSSGRAVIVWNRSDGRDTIIQAAAGDAAGFGAPVDLSAPGADAFDPQVALDPTTGAGAVAWARPVGGDVLVQAVIRTAGGGYSSPVALSAPGADADRPQVAVGDGGEVVALWRREGRDAVVQGSIRPPGGSFGAPVDLSAAGADAHDPRLAVDPSGRAVATWLRADPSDPRIQVATRARGGPFGPATDVSERGTVAAEPRAALDAAGNAVAVWRRAERAADIVQAAGIDEAAPVFGDVGLPPTAVAGQPVTLTASTRDVWSPLALGPIWTFGDGTAASGGRVTHAFAAPGTYAVRVAQADVLGNAAAAERPIVITPRTPPAGGGAEPGPVTSLAAGVNARRPIALYARIGVVRRGTRVHLRVRGRASPVLAGRRVVVERRAGRSAATLCMARVVRSGAFHRLCRVDRLVRGRSITLRVRVRAGSTRATRAAVLPYVTRRIVRPGVRGAAR